MKTKLIISAIILLFSSNAYASLNINQAKALVEEAYTRGDFNALYSLGKILYEDGKHEEGEALLNIACKNGKNVEACNYLNGTSGKHDLENKSVYIGASNQKLLSAPSEFDRGKEFYDKQIYTEAFPIFSHLCNYESYIPACIYLGRSYAWGAGVKSDPNKALQIYRKYLNEVNDKSWKDIIKLDEAATLEYAIGNIDDINKAMDIYKSLVDSKVDWVQKEAKDGLARLPIYIIQVHYISATGNYFNKKIDYDKLRDQLNEIELGNLLYDVREKFTNMRNNCLKYVKDNDSVWSALLSGALIGAKVGVNAAMGDFGSAAGGLAEFYSLWTDSDKTKNECIKSIEYFDKEVQKYNISNKFLNNLYAKYYPKSK